jgi:tetratricopeptide (TPR) repeat protein
MQISVIPYLISGGAVIISFISLTISLIQKRNETRRTLRKTLTDFLENISKISIEMTKLKASGDPNSESNILLRRNYNTQRRLLITHCDMIMKMDGKMATEIDCCLIAMAFESVGDNELAKNYWEKAIERSFSPSTKHMNLRGFGAFCFYSGEVDEGRRLFEDSFKIKMNDGDSTYGLLTDSYLSLARLENDFGTKVEYEKTLNKAMDTWYKIHHEGRKDELYRRLRQYLPDNLKNPIYEDRA